MSYVKNYYAKMGQERVLEEKDVEEREASEYTFGQKSESCS